LIQLAAGRRHFSSVYFEIRNSIFIKPNPILTLPTTPQTVIKPKKMDKSVLLSVLSGLPAESVGQEPTPDDELPKSEQEKFFQITKSICFFFSQRVTRTIFRREISQTEGNFFARCAGRTEAIKQG
jgi:hypothetical protein